MFSPYYARARRRGRGDPLAHCALNVALYNEHGKRWTMTERRAGAVQRMPSTFIVGPSSLAWDADALTIDIDETTFPLPSRIRGRVRLYPGALSGAVFALDAAGEHRWTPLAPQARVEVDLAAPALRWRGTGYVDANAGAAPLEDAFREWAWSRHHVGRRTVVYYDVVRRDASRHALACSFDGAGGCEAVAPPPLAPLPHSRWRIARAAHSDRGHAPAVARTLEDTPFYARSLVATRCDGVAALAVHESLSLDRFRRRWVQALLPFRMPRAWR